MKKSKIAVAALLTALASAPVMSVAYANDSQPASTTACSGCKGHDCKGGHGCKGCEGCKGCKGCEGAKH